MHPSKHFTLLLEGLACLSTRPDGGVRQIYAFHYPGHFLALHGFLFPRSTEPIEVRALTNCSIGTIDKSILEQALEHHPALWRAAMIEASILRQRLITMRWPALQRVAHLLREQLSQLGSDERVIPFSQIEVADAAGLSVVHTDRIFHDLRKLGVLSKERLIEVVNKERLHELAVFQGHHLDVGESLSDWDVRIDG
jgi:CRP-like cAMP-binding protein